MQILVEVDDPAEEHLVRPRTGGSGRLQTEVSCCSETLVSFFGADYFSNFCLRPLLCHADGVCGMNGSPDDASVLSDTSEEAVFANNVENPQFDDADWIALANSAECERHVLGVEPSALNPVFGPLNNPYVQILQTELDVNQNIYMFTEFRRFRADHYPSHIEVMGDTDMDDMELINEIMADDGEQAMVDSGASSNILVMGRGRSGVFRMCSKITPTRTNFSTYGKGKADVDIRGWSWVSWTLQCDLTQEIVVNLARTYIAMDSTGRYRSIWSPGTMKHYGFVFLQGVPCDIHISGSEYSFNLEGPSTDSYIFDRVGHCFECPTVGRGQTLQVLKEIDFGDSAVMERIDQLTQKQVNLLIQAGANRNSDGVEDPQFFNPDAFMSELVSQQHVWSMEQTVQRPLGIGARSRQPTTAPLFDPMPAAEDFSDISAETYGEQLALLTSMTERLHLHCSNSSINVSKSDPQVAQERIHEMLSILQQIADDYAKSRVHQPTVDSEQFNMLQQCAIEAGFVSHLRGDAVPKLGLGGPGIMSSAPHGAPVYQYDRQEPLTLPYLALPKAKARAKAKGEALVARVAKVSSRPLCPSGTIAQFTTTAAAATAITGVL